MDSFLQSCDWAEFQKSLGRKVWEMNGISVIKHNLPLGKSYLYAPRCGGDFLSEVFLKKVKETAKKENAIFLKIEPSSILGELREGKPSVLKKLGFKKAQNIQPRKTLILDVTKSEKDLLEQMHHKTRYNIRLAERKNIKIRKDKTKFEDFWKLIQKTTKRDGFRPHPKEYYKKMLDIPGMELFVAEYPEKSPISTNGASQNKIIAANIVVFHKKQAIYLHGASDYEYRKLMAPHLLQWQQILEAKKRDCAEYDFWGIDDKKWPGVTRFKKGFSGKEIEYPNAYDLTFESFWYIFYRVAKKFR